MCSEIEKGFTFTWRIKNFSLYCQTNGSRLISRSFTATMAAVNGCTLKSSQWGLIIFPRLQKGPEDYVVCYLKRNYKDNVFGSMFKEDDITEVFIDFTVDIIGEDDEKIKSFSVKNQLFIKGKSSCALNLIKTDELISALNSWNSDTLTIRCFMQNAREIEIMKCEALSTICYVHHSVILEVSNNFDFFSKSFELQFFSLLIVLKSSEESVHISVVARDTTPSMSISLKIHLIDVNGFEYDSGEDEHLFEPKRGTRFWDFPDFLKRSRLTSKQPTFVKNGKFELKCIFMVSPTTESKDNVEYLENTIPATESTSAVNKVASLQNDLIVMFREKKQSDVKLKADEQLFYAHKNILSARSPVFSAMFNQDMLEAKTGIVNIKDVNATVLELFLEFLYTDYLHLTYSAQALELLEVADKYQVQSLIEKCSLFLSTHLSNENVCEILQAADMIGHTFLKSKSLDFIKTHAKIILKQPEWSKWTEKNIKLATEVFAQLASRF